MSHGALRPSPDGPILLVRVIPRSHPEGVNGLRAGRLLVRLAAAPVDGSANKALASVLAATYGLARSQVVILRGEKSREKDVLLRGADAAAIAALLPSDCCT